MGGGGGGAWWGGGGGGCGGGVVGGVVGGVGDGCAGAGTGGQVSVGGCALTGEQAGQSGGGGRGQADQGDVFAGVDGQVQVVYQVGARLGQGHVVQLHQGWGGRSGVVGGAAESASVGEPHGCPFVWCGRHLPGTTQGG